MWACIYTSHTASTITLLTTNFTPLPATTAFKGQSGGNRFLKVEPKDTTSTRIVTGKDCKGIYRCGFNASVAGSQGSKILHMSVFKNGTELPNIGAERKIGTTASVDGMAAQGFLRFKEPNEYVDLRVKGESSGVEITLSHFTLSLDLVTTSTARSVIA